MKNVAIPMLTDKKGIKKKYDQNWWVCYLMIAPQIIGFLLFCIYPIIWVFRISFFDYDGVTKIFVGLDNYINAFKDTYYWKSVLNTLFITFGKLPVEMGLALIIACILCRKIKGGTVFRISYFMPSILSPAIMGLVFGFIFAAYGGIANTLLLKLGIIEEVVNWFGSKNTAMFVVCFVSVWLNFGINMIFFMSAIQSISEDLYECATLDGANELQKFMHITFPLLLPISKVIIMLSIVGSMKMSDLILTLTNGGPGGGTEVMMSYVFKNFFGSGEIVQPKYGYSSALGFISAIIVCIITLIYFKVTKKGDAR